MPVAQGLRSFKARILAGFGFVLVFLVLIVGVVWRAGQELDQALVREAASQVTASRVNDMQAALWEARLRLAEYLRSADIASRRSLERAIDRLQVAAGAPGSDGAFANVSTAIPPVRAALADAADSIAARQSAVARLVAASAALRNSGVALATSAARTQDVAVTEAAAALMADLGRTDATAARATDTEDQALFESAITAAAHAEAILQQLDETSSSWVRVQRLGIVVNTGLNDMRIALGALRQSIATRNNKLAALDTAVSHAGTEASVAALAGTVAQRADRFNIRAAQEATQTAVLRIAAGTSILALVIAVGLSLSISRRVGGLAAAVTGLAEGALDTAVPGTKISDELGAVAGAITRFKEKTLEQRATQNMRFEAALNNMRQGLLMLDSRGLVSVMNRRLAAMFGVESLVDTTPDRLVEAVLRTGFLTEQAAETLFLLPDEKTTPTLATQELPDGRTITVSRQPAEDGGWVCTYEDITERCLSEARLDHMALHDALTDLPNRVLFQIHLDRELSRIGRGERLAVILLDLDRFKTINDTLGHQTGDALLQAVAARLKESVRENDVLARLGGDEFAIIQSGAEQPQNARALAQRLVDIVAEPYAIGEHQLAVGVSLGIALAPADGRLGDEILKNADLALYRAKAEGRGTYRFFEPAMDADMRERHQLELDLRKALLNRELVLFYQPLIDAASGKVAAFEALLRWQHPSRGLILPGDFISLAEEVGLIVPIGEWVIEQACHAASLWPEEIRLSVNVSVAQFRSPHLNAAVVRALRTSGLDPSRLDVEITESVLLYDTQATLMKLEKIRALGVGISMDDFGTGYSSLSYLRSFPFDKLKIDKCFLHDVATNENSKAIIRAVAQLGRALGMSVIAEGVETVEQLACIRAEGCIEGQGYLFSRPCPADAIPATITRINKGIVLEATSETAVVVS